VASTEVMRIVDAVEFFNFLVGEINDVEVSWG